MKYFKDTNNNPFVFEDNVTDEIISKVEATHNTTLTEITKSDYESLIAPTPEELKEQARTQAKSDRDEALHSITHTLADGSVYQVRPQDVPNYQLAIQMGSDTDWILADNTVRHTTIAELQEVMDSGIQQGKEIWDNYLNAIKSM